MIFQEKLAGFGSLIFITLTFLSTNPEVQAVVTTDDPLNQVVAADEYTGVVSLDIFGQQGCTGTLLTGGLHVITAGHCITNLLNIGLTPEEVISFPEAVFDLPTGRETRFFEDIFLSPQWGVDSNFSASGDFAVIKLSELAPLGASTYELYTSMDEVGQIGTFVGYGALGQGSTGEDLLTRGTAKVRGQNKIDLAINAEIIDLIPVIDSALPETQLLMDFDSGLSENDVFGTLLGINDLGLGIDEAFPAAGDSGGSLLIDGKIAGIVSYGISFPEISNPPDIDLVLNSSYGEIVTFTRISFYANFINDAIAGRAISIVATTPEPNFILGLMAITSLGLIGSNQKKT